MTKMTPREIAHHIALHALKKAYDEPEALELFCWALDVRSSLQVKRTKNWIAHLHNKLLDQSGLSGDKLEETK